MLPVALMVISYHFVIDGKNDISELSVNEAIVNLFS